MLTLPCLGLSFCFVFKSLLGGGVVKLHSSAGFHPDQNWSMQGDDLVPSPSSSIYLAALHLTQIAPHSVSTTPIQGVALAAAVDTPSQGLCVSSMNSGQTAAFTWLGIIFVLTWDRKMGLQKAPNSGAVILQGGRPKYEAGHSATLWRFGWNPTLL